MVLIVVKFTFSIINELCSGLYYATKCCSLSDFSNSTIIDRCTALIAHVILVAGSSFRYRHVFISFLNAVLVVVFISIPPYE